MANNTAPAAAAALNGHRSSDDDPRITPHSCETAICPVHGTNHKADGGWIEVHNPLHPRMTEPFRGRTCVTKVEYLAWLKSRP